MKKRRFTKVFERAMLFGLVFSVLLSFAKFSGGCETLKKNILRIHIIANSDSAADQSVKLKVRDAVVNYTGDIFSDCESIESAKDRANNDILNIERICKNTLAANDFSYDAKVKTGKTYFDTREYDTFTLPAGYYDSLIVTLGEGKGHNWWCVIYPSVCIGGSKEKLKNIGKDSDICLNPKKYKIRFKTVEWYEKIKKKVKGG